MPPGDANLDKQLCMQRQGRLTRVSAAGAAGVAGATSCPAGVLGAASAAGAAGVTGLLDAVLSGEAGNCGPASIHPWGFQAHAQGL